MKQVVALLRPFIVFWIVAMFTVFSHSVSFAQESPTYTMINKNQPAPYSGVLLSPEAMAKILADSDFAQKKLQLECEYGRKIAVAEVEQSVEDLKAKLTLEEKYNQQIQELQTKELEKLRDVAFKTEPEGKQLSGLWWGLGGFGVGALIAFGSVWAVAQLERN